MMTKEGYMCTKILLYQYTLHWLFAMVLKDYDAALLYNCWFFYYNNGAVDMQIWALLIRIQCKVSDTQVTVKACGPLVLIYWESCLLPVSRSNFSLIIILEWQVYFFGHGILKYMLGIYKSWFMWKYQT